MNKIVWIDLETGGLNDEVINLEEPIILPNGRKIEHVSGSQYYPILEIGIVITDNDLNILDTYQAEIKNNKRVLDKMDAWCMDQHNKTGLIQKSLKSEKTIEQVTKEAVDFLNKHDLPKRVPMAGSSIHFDHEFIRQQMPELNSKFSHQHIDVTSLYKLYQTKYPEVTKTITEMRKQTTHLVIDDIKDSIKIAKMYSDLMPKYTVEDLLQNKMNNKRKPN